MELSVRDRHTYVDANNNPNAKLPVLADQQIDPAMPGYNYIEITTTSQPLGDPVICHQEPNFQSYQFQQIVISSTSPEEANYDTDAKSFYTDSKAAQVAKDDGDF